MRFNPKARLDTSRVRSGGGGRGGGGMAAGPGGQMRMPMPGGTRAGGALGLVLIVAVIILLRACGGVDLTGAMSGASSGYSTSRFQGDTAAYQSCQTGHDANEHPTTCGVVAVENSLVDYWKNALPQQSPRTSFQPEAAIVTFSGSTPTGCGQASSDTGPFYCPGDQTIYFDPSFFHAILQQQLHGPSGAFVEPYVIAHEFGHHIQDLLGTMNKVKTQQGPNSDSVRLELQADCYAGMWAHNATTTEDSQGNVLIQDLTQQDVQDAIAAAKSVGDDTIQRITQGNVDSELWTHGSSAARVRWFTTGYENGTLDACDTFSVPTVE
ncbi:MAG: neutral zinc metallopeptidase [Nocardioides sp.]|nr:neutral zinc metallopeptidase [Nocardioides sp.]